MRIADRGLVGEQRTIGRGGDYRNVPTAVLRLRGLRGFDLVHAWGHSALIAAGFAGCGRIVYSPSPFADRREIEWLRAIMAYRPVQVMCESQTLWNALASRGIPSERCHLIRPAIDFARLRRRRDAQLRSELGFGDDDYVIFSPDAEAGCEGHIQAAWATAILHTLDPRWRLLVGGESEARPLLRFVGHVEQATLLHVARQRLNRPVEMEALLGAADMVAFAAGGNSASWPVAAAMAAGLPIIASTTASLSELLEDRHNCLMVRPRSPAAMARRIIDLREDASLQWRLADVSRTEAYEFFSMTRFAEQLSALYTQLAGNELVTIPQPQPGAGLRFHGRA